MTGIERVVWFRRNKPLRILRKRAEKARRKDKIYTVEEIEFIKEKHRRNTPNFYRIFYPENPLDFLDSWIWNNWTIKPDLM